jgi:hypothetical protein
LTKKGVPHAFYKDCMYLTESVFTLSLIPESYITLDDHDLIIARFEKIISRTNAPFLMTNDIQ